MRTEVSDILDRLRHSLGIRASEPGLKSYYLHEPTLGETEKQYLASCIDSGFVSSVGKYVDQFEKDLERVTGAKKAVVCVNGTSALHIACLLAGVKANDEVMLPSLTFVATANAVAYCHAIPHFVEASAQTLNVDPRKLEEYLSRNCVVRDGFCYNQKTSRKITALINVHIFGHIGEVELLKTVCEKFHIELIEDAAESLGSLYNNRPSGSIGKLSTLSFNGNKIVTTGGGGAVLCADEQTGMRAKHLTTTAKKPHPYLYVHDEVGFNYRMPNLNAALGCAQLEKLEKWVKQKRSLAQRYLAAFQGCDSAFIFSEPEHSTSNYWLNALVLKKDDLKLRDELLAQTNSAKIHTRPIWEPMHTLPMYQQCPRMDLTVTESLCRRVVNLPSSPFLIEKL